jgi:hypothetical protein
MFSMEGWEHDHTREIFPVTQYQHVDWNTFSALPDKTIQPEVMIYNVENAEDDGSYRKVKALVEQYRIKILVHFADEHQGLAHKWKWGNGANLYYLVRHFSKY